MSKAPVITYSLRQQQQQQQKRPIYKRYSEQQQDVTDQYRSITQKDVDNDDDIDDNENPEDEEEEQQLIEKTKGPRASSEYYHKQDIVKLIQEYNEFLNAISELCKKQMVDTSACKDRYDAILKTQTQLKPCRQDVYMDFIQETLIEKISNPDVCVYIVK
jgi:hypothetical protein